MLGFKCVVLNIFLFLNAFAVFCSCKDLFLVHKDFSWCLKINLSLDLMIRNSKT